MAREDAAAPKAGGQRQAPLRLACSINEAAAALNISRAGFYRLLAEGELAVIKIHHRTIVPVTELERFIAARLAESQGGAK